MAIPEELTRRQRMAVEAPAARVCVAAGPGAGKTRVLVRRVTDGVEAGHLRLDRVLALTFTENAAGEMKQRLAERFSVAGRESERRQVQQAYVSTIHGFCARLLREHPIEAGVDPRFRVLDELEAGLWKARVMTATLNELRDRDPQVYAEFARHFEQPVQGLLLGVYDEIRRLGADPQERGALLVTRETSEVAFDRVEERLRNLEEGVRRRERKYQRAVQEIRQCVEWAQRAAGLVEALEALDQAYQTIDLTRLSAPDLKPSFRVLRGDPTRDDGAPAADSLTGLAALLVEEAGREHRRFLAEALAEADRAYANEKRRLSALDFEDLERHALRLLSDDARARAIGTRFEEILVDEYQDTSVVQARIMERLAAHARLFVVGDPKQSIYGFRNAEPKNFEDAWRQSPDEGRIPLLEDFRSRPEIVAAVNTFFHTVAGLGGAIPFESLEHGSQFEPKEIPSVEVLVSTAGRDSDERRCQEARHLARRIRELIVGAQGLRPPLRITNRTREDCGRALGYGDVAMLFRSTADMALYEGALRDEGIPYFAETGRGFYDAREVADVVNFLRVLDNARDEVALAAVLRSPLCGLSDDALFLLALRPQHSALSTQHWDARLSGKLDEAETLGLPAEDLERLRRFRQLFARLREESVRRPLDSLVREIVAATGYEEILLREPNGARHVANLHKLADIAHTLSAAELGSPGQFARAVDRFRIGEVREGQAQLTAASEGTGAVRLMTMHAAKGLEFPVVVLPDLSRQPNPQKSPVDFSPDFGLGFQYKVGTEARSTLSLLNIHWQKQGRDDVEENRVLFVAMTRAMEHLVLSAGGQTKRDGSCGSLGRLGDMCKSFLILPLRLTGGWRREQIRGLDPFEISLLVTSEAFDRPEVAQAFSLCVPAPAPAQAEGRCQEPDQSDFAASVTDVMEFEACPRRYYLGRYLGFGQGEGGSAPAERAEPPAEQDDEFPAVELGQAVHALLAVLVGALAAGGHARPSPSGNNSFAAVVLEALPERVRAEVERLARRFTESELGRRVAAMKDVKTEEPIYGVVDGHFLHGKLDLHAGDLIVDYKAGSMDKERYRLQMLLYALLAGAGEAVLFDLAKGRAVPIELAPEAFEEARAAVGRFFDAQRKLDFPAVVKDHCFSCVFSGNLCREPQRRLITTKTPRHQEN